MAVQLTAYSSPLLPNWCPGCGNFAIWTCLKQALSAEDIDPFNVVLCFDIGCNGNGADKINAYNFKGLHGRSIPLGSGVSIANHKLPVIAISGDGASLDEGINHIIQSIRSNYNMVFIMHNNCDFGLTTGQATPTTPKGMKMNSAPYGVVEERLNPGQLALTAGASFVAKAFTGNIPQMTAVIREAIKHPGFAYVEVLQHCPTYNKFQDHAWLSERVYDISGVSSYNNGSREEAYKIISYDNEKIATGVIFQDKGSIAYYDRLPYRKDAVTVLKDEVRKYNIEQLQESFI
jgi:2-oxoglutarate ferredoxin oxidoreductase subunit beta